VAAASRDFGEAHLSAADGVAHESRFGVSDHPVRFAYPPHEEGIKPTTRVRPSIHSSTSAATVSKKRSIIHPKTAH